MAQVSLNPAIYPDPDSYRDGINGGVQILCFSSFQQSCQPYGFNVIVLLENQYCAKKNTSI